MHREIVIVTQRGQRAGAAGARAARCTNGFSSMFLGFLHQEKNVHARSPPSPAAAQGSVGGPRASGYMRCILGHSARPGARERAAAGAGAREPRARGGDHGARDCFHNKY